MGDIFQEVDEEVRREKFKSIWKAYGGHIIAAVVALVLGTTIAVGWREYESRRQLEESNRFMAAVELLKGAKYQEAASAFEELAENAEEGYSLISRFRAATAHKAGGNHANAVKTILGISSDSNIDELYRSLANLLIVMLKFEVEESDDLGTELKRMSGDDSIWRHSARELTGILAFKNGELELAKSEFQKLADDLGAPRGTRARALRILQVIGD